MWRKCGGKDGLLRVYLIAEPCRDRKKKKKMLEVKLTPITPGSCSPASVSMWSGLSRGGEHDLEVYEHFILDKS